MYHQQGKPAPAPYPFVGSVMPCSWYYPCYYSPADYSSMYMKLYIIQYPIAYPSGTLQRPVACSSNLVQSNVCTNIEAGEDNNKQNSKGMQLRWCPSGLSHTQKRKLQILRKRGAMEQPFEERPAKSTRTRKEWRLKQASTST
jgi:hypothetical protein